MFTAAVIGGGAIGERHLSALQNIEGIQAAAVVETNLERGKQLSEKFGIPAYWDLTDMLEEVRPQIAAIALPHHLHMDAALKCISYGCHLLLEKPMALSVEECDRILEAAKKKGIILMVGHTMHYLPENLKAKEIASEGRLGKLVMIHDVRFVNYYAGKRPDWFFERAKAGGGIMTNLGSHSIDRIQWLTNSKVLSVHSHLSFEGIRGDVEGAGMVYLQLHSGISAAIVQSGYAGAPRSEAELIFTDGMLRIVQGKGLYMSRGGEYEPVAIPESVPPLEMEWRELMECIREGRQPASCSGEYARTVVAVLESIYRSHQTGTEQAVLA